MAYEINDKEITENIDLNYVIDFYVKNREDCIRIMRNRSFVNGLEEIGNGIIVEPIEDKQCYQPIF